MTGATKRHGRLPADQAGNPRQAMWTAIKKCAGSFTIADIVDATKMNRSTVYDYLRGLTEAGHLEYTPVTQGQPGQWQLIHDTGFHAPRVRRDGKTVTSGEVSGQLWLAMCHLKDFDFRDLMQSASIEIAESAAKDYCSNLLAAGYFRVLKKANPAKGQIARYRLIRNTGPKAPQIQRVKRVFDPNTGEAFFTERRA